MIVEALEDKKGELVENAWKEARDVLVGNGFSEKKITFKHQKTKHGVARDIIKEAENYDILVIGKRGISGIREFLFGGTTQKVINGVDNVAVFIGN